MKSEIIQALTNSPLFKGIEEPNIEKQLTTIEHQIKEYKKGELIAIEEDNCEELGIVVFGNIQIQKSYPSGKVVVLDILGQGDIFGEIIVFSKEHRFPATILSITDSTILLLSKTGIKQLCKENECFLENFLQSLTSKILMLNRKVKILSYKTLKEKIADLLMEEYKHQQTLVLTLPYDRKEMADLLGIPRPSLSRELSIMKEEGLIDYYKNTVRILQLNALRELII